jgi:hypothetical protein
MLLRSLQSVQMCLPSCVVVVGVVEVATVAATAVAIRDTIRTVGLVDGELSPHLQLLLVCLVF